MTTPTPKQVVDVALGRLDEMIARLDQQGARMLVMRPEDLASPEFTKVLHDYIRNSGRLRAAMREMLGSLVE